MQAYELSTLTGTQVMLLVASETGHVYTFATRKLQPMITSDAGKALIQVRQVMAAGCGREPVQWSRYCGRFHSLECPGQSRLPPLNNSAIMFQCVGFSVLTRPGTDLGGQNSIIILHLAVVGRGSRVSQKSQYLTHETV